MNQYTSILINRIYPKLKKKELKQKQQIREYVICGEISNGEERENGLEEICQNKWLMTFKK